MANTRAGNVILVDTSATFSDIRSVKSIKYIGNTNGTATLKKTDTNGNALWQESGTANIHDANVCIKCPTGIRVEVTNSAKVYLYLG
jgi:hypothetical protein